MRIYTTPEGKTHNPHRPATECNSGEKVYYLNNKEHNIVGPSRITSNGRRLYGINSKLP